MATTKSTSGSGSASGSSGKTGTGGSGPGTGRAAPEDTKQRSAATTLVASDTKAAPATPTDVNDQTKPKLGHEHASTNPVSAAAVLSSAPGNQHVQLVDAQGGEVDVADLFADEDPPSTMKVVTQRVYQQFQYPGASTVTTHLLYPAGARVSREVADRLTTAVTDVQASRS